LDGLGNIKVNDESDVGLVDAHSEGDGGHDDLYIFVQEEVLSFGPQLAVQSGVISYRLDAIGYQHVCQLLCRLPVQRIDNTALALLLYDVADNAFDGLILLDLGLYLIIEIASVEGGDKYFWVAQAQIFDYVALNLGGSGGGQCNDGNVGIDLVHHFPQ